MGLVKVNVNRRLYRPGGGVAPQRGGNFGPKSAKQQAQRRFLPALDAAFVHFAGAFLERFQSWLGGIWADKDGLRGQLLPGSE